MSDSRKDIKPASPPQDFPARQPPLMAVLPMLGVWWCAIVGHFLACGLCAYTFVIRALFGVLFGGASIMSAYDLGMFSFFVLIFLSIGAAIATGLLLGPEVGDWPQRYGAYPAAAPAFAVLTGFPMLLILRGGK